MCAKGGSGVDLPALSLVWGGLIGFLPVYIHTHSMCTYIDIYI